MHKYAEHMQLYARNMHLYAKNKQKKCTKYANIWTLLVELQKICSENMQKYAVLYVNYA